MIRRFLRDYHTIFETLHVMDRRDVMNLQKIMSMPEYGSLESLYKNISLKIYKSILESEDVKTAKRLVEFITAIRNTPKQYANRSLTQHFYDDKKGSNDNVTYAEGNSQTGEII